MELSCQLRLNHDRDAPHLGSPSMKVLLIRNKKKIPVSDLCQQMNYSENKGESQGWDHPSSQRTKQCLPKMSPARSFNGFYMKSEQNTGRAKPRVWAALTIHRSHQMLYSLALKLATPHAEGCSPWFFAYHKVALSIIYI